ncbi:MAG: peptidylprolyl isomerase [Oscillospiraceae bacterium]|nr:peptidylprolyl isomerase [Oscillospiraceae bacterium]
MSTSKGSRSADTGVKTPNRRETARQQEAAKRKKTRAIGIAVVAVVIVLLGCALFVNSKAIRRMGTAYQVDDMRFSPAEFTFHYYNNYYDYVEYVYTDAYEYANVLLPDTTQSLDVQMYDETTTWKQHFQEYCEECLTRDVALYKEGMESGFEMTADQMQKYQDEVEGIESSATALGYSNVNKYLARFYGPACTYDILKEQLKFLYYADSYEEYFKENLAFSDEEVRAKYEEKKDSYDSFTFRYYIVYADKTDETQYDSEEERAAAEEKALKEAHAKAETAAAGIHSEQDMIDAARADNAETYAEDDSTRREYDGQLLGSTYGPWLRDPERKPLDVGLFDVTVGTYVVMFLDRTDNGYPTRNARTIVVNPAVVDSADYAADESGAYDNAVAAAKEDARKEAEDLLNRFRDDPTEENFAQLATENSDGTNAAEGGLLSQAGKSTLTGEPGQWLFDEARKPGDVEMMWSENAGAYYIVYYVGEDMPYNMYLADKQLKTDAMNAWEEQLTDGITAKKTWMYALS